MNAGDDRIVADSIVQRPRALGSGRMIKPGHRRPYWLSPTVLLSGCRCDASSPVSSRAASCSRLSLRLGVDSSLSPSGLPNQSARSLPEQRPDQPDITGPISCNPPRELLMKVALSHASHVE
jgi:hypothetical protein